MRTIPHISKKPNRLGYYEIRWSEYRGNTWRSMKRSTKTKVRTEAEAALARFLALRPADEAVKNPSVREIYDAYIKHWSTPRGNDVTDTLAMRAPLAAFGTMPAAMMRPDDIDAYTRRRLRGDYASDSKFTAKSRRKASPGTIRREITALQAVLNWGSRNNMVPGKPKFTFPKPEDSRPRQLWLSPAQEKDVLKLLDAAPVRVQLFVRLMMAYGLRKGALMDLTFGPQINFDTGTIDFAKPGARVTRKRRPVAAMSATIRALVKELAWQAGERVFSRQVEIDARKLLSDGGYGWVTPHVFKHTAITNMLSAGVQIDVVSAITATDIRTIYKTYRHFFVSGLASVVEARGM